MVEKVEFKGVWIPRVLWNDNSIGWSEKCLLAEIDRLVENGRCFASNGHFARFFGLSKDRISKLIASLKEKGYIETFFTYKENSKEVDRRVITTIGYRRKQLGGIGENTEGGIGENAEDNITVNNKTNITYNIPPSADPDVPDFFEKPVFVSTKYSAGLAEKEWRLKSFEEFWDKYGKKKARAKVEPIFMKLSKEDIEAILLVVDDHRIITERDNAQYRPHPTTWLSQRRWEDDIAAELKRYKPRVFKSDATVKDNVW